MQADVAYTFPSNQSAPAEARSVSRSWAAESGYAAAIALELVTSELVTNAIRHGAGDVTMSLSMTTAGIEVRVHDHGVDLPVAREVGVRSPGGRGLHMVESLCASWGTEVSPGGMGKTVWAVIGPEGLADALSEPQNVDAGDHEVRPASRSRNVRL